MMTVEKKKMITESADCTFEVDDNPEKFLISGKTAAMLAHEIKTPLTSIKMNIDMFCEDANLPEHKKKSLLIIQKEISRLNKLVNTFLQFSGHNEMVLTKVNLYSLIEDVRLVLVPLLTAKQIHMINDTGVYSLIGDYDMLKSVFLNLISNSIDAVEKGGKIEISSRNDFINHVFSILIKDNGCGIENKGNIFEPFFSTKKCGTGLGLAISRKIISLHQGTLILLSSKPGETIFEISFLL